MVKHFDLEGLPGANEVAGLSVQSFPAQDWSKSLAALNSDYCGLLKIGRPWRARNLTYLDQK